MIFGGPKICMDMRAVRVFISTVIGRIVLFIFIGQ